MAAKNNKLEESEQVLVSKSKITERLNNDELKYKQSIDRIIRIEAELKRERFINAESQRILDELKEKNDLMKKQISKDKTNGGDLFVKKNNNENIEERINSEYNKMANEAQAKIKEMRKKYLD